MDISVIIPVFNEIDFIENLMNDLLSSNLIFCGKKLDVEFLVIDGGSTDGTLEYLKKLSIQQKNCVKLIHNPKKFQVHGLNIGISKACGDIIIRCDAHSSYPKNYLITLYKYIIKNPNIGNVGLGSIAKNNSTTNESKVVSNILSSKFGVGSSHRNISINTPIEVDTLLFGAWHKSIFEKVGLFDENFIRGQDYEHNFRIKKQGMKVIIIPGDKFIYYTRDKIKNMFNMIFQYAHAKVHIIKKHHVLPTYRSLFPIILWLIVLISLFYPIVSIFVLPYILLAIYFSVKFARQRKDILLYLYGFIGIHFFYFLGFLKGIYDYYIKNKNHIDFKHTR